MKERGREGEKDDAGFFVVAWEAFCSGMGR